jgi:type III pantothenate kinase
MLLTFDVGNTHTVLGLFDDSKLTAHWRFTTERNRTADELRLTIRSLLAETGVGPDDVEGIAVASVVPSIDAPLQTGLEPLIAGKIRFLTHRTSPIELRVDEPWSVGADRIANSFAGHELHGGPILVIDFGTATTFDLVSEDGAFLGGAIAPEMHLTARALTDRAAQLPSVALDLPNTVVGRTTAENIRAGVVFGFLDLVDGLIHRFHAEYPGLRKVLATGGKGALFYRQLDSIDLFDPHLTLTGLFRWWQKTANPKDLPFSSASD